MWFRRGSAAPFRRILAVAMLVISPWPASGAGEPSKGASRAVIALARLEPASGLIAVGVTPGARLQSVEASIGQKVEANAVLAVLEGSAAREEQFRLAELQKAKADFLRQIKREELALSRKQFDSLQATRLDSQKQAVALLEESVKIAAADLARFIEGNVSKPQISQQQLLLNTTKGNLLEAQVKLRELEVAIELQGAQRALEDKQLSDANPEYELANRQVALAKADLELTKIRAPIAGEVLQVLAHAGEVSSGPILYLGDTSSMVAVAEVYQSDVAAIRVGEEAKVSIFGTTVAGKIERVGALVGKNKIVNISPIAPTDRRVIEVRVALNDPVLAAKYINMEVEVTFNPTANGAKP
ncbi:MAG: HlyD family efflux transporter periplasmic adaptor subunit [Planctomycetota bacterium]